MTCFHMRIEDSKNVGGVLRWWHIYPMMVQWLQSLVTT